MKKIQKPKRLAGNLEGEGGPSKAKKTKKQKCILGQNTQTCPRERH